MADSDSLFTRASQHLPSLIPDLSPPQLLQLYALYKQATIGPCNIPKPRFYEIKAKEKYEAWSKLQQMPSDVAKQKYIDIITDLDPDFPSNENVGGEGWVTVSTPLNTDTVINELDKTIFDFCKENNLAKIRELLEQNPQKNVTLKDEHGLGLVHWAADRGNVDILTYLLECNTDVNMTDNDGQTALHYACSCDYYACVECLLKAGADCHLCDNDGVKPVDLTTNPEILKLLNEFM